MNQVSKKLRRAEGGYIHWCPGCKQTHQLPDSWKFDGNLEAPTFTPSFKHTGKKIVVDEHGKWTGEWVRDANCKAVDDCCHYILTAGILNFCTDSLHELAGKSVPLPDLPDWLKDV